MRLSLAKGFWMMKLLNRDYGAPVRGIAASLGYGLAMLTTGQPVLARELAGRLWRDGDFKLGARRGAWYLRRSWIGLDISQDDFFDPTEGMSDAQLDVLGQFVQSRARKLPALTRAADQALIAARKLNNNTQVGSLNTNISVFNDACDRLLALPADPTLSPAETDQTRTGDFPIANARTTLSDFAALFPIATLPWFLISGTFLGLIRENGFLPHDYDIDLGVFEDQIDIPAIMAKIHASDRFVLKKYDRHHSTLLAPKTPAKNSDVPYILKLVHVSGVHIDLFIHYRDTSTAPAIDWHGSSLHRWENSAFELTEYTFYDQTVLGPADADRYLTENYGDWRTPVTDFNCTTDTPNLALVPHPVAIVLFLKRYVLARGAHPTQAAKLEAELLHSGFLVRQEDDSLTFSSVLFETSKTLAPHPTTG